MDLLSTLTVSSKHSFGVGALLDGLVGELCHVRGTLGCLGRDSAFGGTFNVGRVVDALDSNVAVEITLQFVGKSRTDGLSQVPSLAGTARADESGSLADSILNIIGSLACSS